MRVLVVYSGRYGERILQNIAKRAPKHWSIAATRIQRIPPLDSDIGLYTPMEVEKAELMLSLLEHAEAAALIPAIAKKAEVEALIAPVDNDIWLPQGEIKRIRESLPEVCCVFPRPFCSLAPSGHRAILEFAKLFGRPKLVIRGREVVEEVEVLRGAPCGSTWHVANRLVGCSAEKAVWKAALLHQLYPCMASTKLDPISGRDSLLHISAKILMSEVERALREAGMLEEGVLEKSK